MKKYVSERITNISELEQIIQSAYLMSSTAKTQLLFEPQSHSNPVELLNAVEKELEKAMCFDFCIERRTTVDAT